jgi:16S rRNA A1518/A1519 N6-dimethyltransferase RsmA/KsgA/DIM1 with predicted DNA glycosylase/AP lyase activity
MFADRGLMGSSVHHLLLTCAAGAQVRLAFAERRKMLRNTLQSRFSADQLAAAFAAADVPLNARPQQLHLEEFVSLWQQLPRTTVNT